jgi:hypothetical protein
MAFYPQQVNPGSFVPTTNIWDVQQLFRVDVNSDEFKELLVRLYQNVNNIALVLNTKTSGYFVQQEFVIGDVFFQPTATITSNANPQLRQSYRMVVDFGALPNAGTKSVAHNIPDVNSTFTFTNIYATASDPIALAYIPIPYASTTGDDIELDVDATNVNITTTSNRSAFTRCYVVLEYLKN